MLSQNPYKPRDNYRGITYTDTKLYAKYALRDFLRWRYHAAADTVAPFTISSAVPSYTYTSSSAELASLANLNAAWGTGYTTCDTSSGSLASGTNAYGTGTGFMDENGSRILAGTRISYNDVFCGATVRRDLDDFVAFFAQRYGSILAGAFAQGDHPPLLLPLYNPPDFVAAAVAPYADAFWTSAAAADCARIYEAGRRPILNADYATARPDSPLYYRAAISSVTYSSATGRSRVVAPTLRYFFRMGWPVGFLDSAGARPPTGWLYAYPRVQWVEWNTIEVSGDYTPYIAPGMSVEQYDPYADGLERTQSERAQSMIGRYDSLLNLRGSDGAYFIAGFEHWAMYDNEPSNSGEIGNFGIATVLDNAYDGVEARRAVGTDSRGYAVGGEEGDYGDLLGPLGAYLGGVTGRIESAPSAGGGHGGGGCGSVGLELLLPCALIWAWRRARRAL